ncbi:hydrolase or metal-binding protein, partial [Stutzerimonas sp. Brlt_13]
EEFYPEGEAPAAVITSHPSPSKSSLAEKLDAQAARQTPPKDQDQGGRHAPAQAESQ